MPTDFRIYDIDQQQYNESLGIKILAYLGHLSASQIVRYVHYGKNVSAYNVNRINNLLK